MFNYERFEELRKAKGLTKTYMASKLNRNSVIFQDWKQGKSTPRQDQLRIVADMLGTTPEYLTDETDNKTPAPGEGSGWVQPSNDLEERFILAARCLRPEQQEVLLWVLETVARSVQEETPQNLRLPLAYQRAIAGASPAGR